MRALSCLVSLRVPHLMLGSLLLLSLIAGCAGGNNNDDDDDGADACVSSEQESAPATFTHSVSGGVLNLGIDQTGGGGLAVLYCLPAPHSGNYQGIQADAVLETPGSTPLSDVDLILELYESSGGNVVLTELVVKDNTATYFVEACDGNDTCTTLQPDTTISTGLSNSALNTISILWNGSDTIEYAAGPDSKSQLIDTSTWPVVNANLTSAEVGFGIYASTTGSATTTGKFDNIALSTDGVTFPLYDDFNSVTGSYDGGSKWYLFSGPD